MKKVLISMAAGAMALGGALPATAANYDLYDTGSASIWEIVDNQSDQTTSMSELADLILIAGMATMLDTCGNGKPQYTLFAPKDDGTDYDSLVVDILDSTIAELQSSPAVVRGVLNDHLVNGSFSPWQLDLDSITIMTARSGFTLRNEEGVTVNDQNVTNSYQACNGFVYEIDGFIDSTPQVATEGLNSLDTPKDGTPGGSNSLPDTL